MQGRAGRPAAGSSEREGPMRDTIALLACPAMLLVVVLLW